MAQALLRAGADADAALASDGRTPLHLAAANGHVDVLHGLLAAGANVGATLTGAGLQLWTHLHAAAAGGHTAVGVALVAAGAPLQAADEQGRLPADVWPADAPPGEFDVAVAAGLALRADAVARRADAALACVALHVASGRVAVPPPNVVVSVLAALR